MKFLNQRLRYVRAEVERGVMSSFAAQLYFYRLAIKISTSVTYRRFVLSIECWSPNINRDLKGGDLFGATLQS